MKKIIIKSKGQSRKIVLIVMFMVVGFFLIKRVG